MDEKIVKDLIDRLIDLSLFAEDIGDGDHTTLFLHSGGCNGQVETAD